MIVVIIWKMVYFLKQKKTLPQRCLFINYILRVFYNPNCLANKSGKIPNAINAKMMNTPTIL